jgi:TatD DNase family protein
VETLEPDWEQELTRRLQDGHVLGVGEIGLDDSNPRYPSLERQRPLFRRQLEIAHSLDLPVIMHSRGAEEEVIDTCRELGISRAVFHCFTGTIDTLRRLLDAGYHVSWSGIITFKKSGLDEAVRFAPLDRLFIETDTPYLAPVPHRGKPNEPGLVSLVGEHVARLKDVPPQRVAEAIRKSFRAVFAPTTHTRQ